MKKFVIIAAVNAVLLGGLSIVGINALAHGCNVGGSCIGSPGLLTWSMAIVPLLIMAGVALKFAPGAIKALRSAKADALAEQQAALEASGLAAPHAEELDAAEIEGNAQFESRLARFRAAAEREEAEAQLSQEERDVRAIADNEEADKYYTSAMHDDDAEDDDWSADEASLGVEPAALRVDEDILPGDELASHEISGNKPSAPFENLDDDELIYGDTVGGQPVELPVAPIDIADEWDAVENSLPPLPVAQEADADVSLPTGMPDANSDAALRIWGHPEIDGADAEAGMGRAKMPDFLASLAAESWDVDDTDEEGEDGGFAWNFKPIVPSAIEESADVDAEDHAVADDHADAAMADSDDNLVEDVPVAAEEQEEIGLDFGEFNSRTHAPIVSQADPIEDDYSSAAPLAIIGQHPDANANIPAVEDHHAANDKGNWHGLFDDMAYGGAPVLRSAAIHGFPWVAAGIGMVAQSLQDHIRLPAVGAYPAEIDAWGQIAESLPYAEPIGAEDCEAFVDWTNGLLAYAAASGQSDAAVSAVNAAVAALLDEAANDAGIADELPGDLVEQHIMMLEQRHARRA